MSTQCTDQCSLCDDADASQDPLATSERHDSAGEALLDASSGEGDTRPPSELAPTVHSQSSMVHAYLTQGLRPSQINFPLSHASKLFHSSASSSTRDILSDDIDDYPQHALPLYEMALTGPPVSKSSGSFDRCILDSGATRHYFTIDHPNFRLFPSGVRPQIGTAGSAVPVSYTHLTLPTKA